MHQIGAETTLQGILIVVENGLKGRELKLEEFLALRNWECFGLQLINHDIYAQTEAASGFNFDSLNLTVSYL